MKNILYIILVIFVSCKSSQYFNKDNKFTTVYRLLHIDNYGLEISEKSFWSQGKSGYDFAVHKCIVNQEGLLAYLETLNQDKENVGINYHFAFVFKKDTVYASHNLKRWLLKKNGKPVYYTGPDENTPLADTVYYNNLFYDPFFRSWSDR